jgi:hypothetical protein
MVKRIVVTKNYIKLITDEATFYIGAKHFETIIKAIETAKTLPETGIIAFDIEEEGEETLPEEEEIPEEEEELF